MTIQIAITPNGRMSLPADIRKRLGLAGGGSLLVEETEDGVILRTVTTLPSDARTTIPTGREPGIAHVPVIHARSSEVARSHITPGPSKP